MLFYDIADSLRLEKVFRTMTRVLKINLFLRLFVSN